MEKENIISYLQGLENKLVPMKIVLKNTISYLDGTTICGSEHKKELAKSLQQIAEFIEKSREDYAKYDEPQYFSSEEWTATIHAIVELIPNTIRADFSNMKEIAGTLLPTA